MRTCDRCGTVCEVWANYWLPRDYVCGQCLVPVSGVVADLAPAPPDFAAGLELLRGGKA